jgi:translation initiation factor 4E|uniref:Eukaryotic translation initiation factor 4E n=1 Tax=viral metagenome TaxID=1070528 RepID=A0A6C0EHN8_9ZZZZ
MSNSNLKYNWKIWYHAEKDNWKLTGYKHIYTIQTANDFWKFYNNWDKVGGITNKHFFVMKDDITPIWEDQKNINGGCWSFKISEDQVDELWDDISIYLVCDILCPTISDEIVGISICLKKNSNCIVKIWNNNSKNNSLKLLNENILKKWGTDIIYIAHIPNIIN